MSLELPYRNRSPYGWWIAIYFIRAAWDDEETPADESLHRVWENTVILTAPDREVAFTKATAIGRAEETEFDDADTPGRNGRWRFEGLRSLMPIHNRLEDGAEIIWEDHESLPMGKLRSWVKEKQDLEAFDDTVQYGDQTALVP